MIGASLIFIAALVGGAIATYLFDDRSRISFRLAAGACIGQAALGLVGYMLATTFGMRPLAVFAATGLVVGAPIVLVRGGLLRLGRELRAGLAAGMRDFRQGRPGFRLRVMLLVGTFLLLLPLFERAMYIRPDGIFTSYVDNFADLTLHIGIINGFVHGENFPPEHPEYAGTRLAYPFLVDFVAAMPVTTGASLKDAMFAQNMVLMIALVVLFYNWARRLTGSRRAALLVPFLVLFCGGLGFTMLPSELMNASEGAWHYLANLPHDYSAYENLYRWDNAFVFWFVPMRSMMLGVPLFLIVTGVWWRALGQEAPELAPERQRPAVPDPAGKRRRVRRVSVPERASAPPSEAPRPTEALFSPTRMMLGAGAVAGLLPLTHAHTFVTLMLMASFLCLITRKWRLWFLTCLIASVIALPQILWAVSGTSAKAEKFFGWNFGWSGHEKAEKWIPELLDREPLKSASPRLREAVTPVLNFGCIAWYWFINTGAFIPLTVIALAWRRGGRIVRKPLRIAVLPFLLFCFIVPNVVKLAPWDWDNIKVLIYWFIPSTPIVALLLVRLARWRRLGLPLAALLFASMTLSGALDIWRVLTGTLQWCVFDPSQLAAGEMIQKVAPPRAVILNAAMHNHPFLLAGRHSFMGYPGTLWTHGIVYEEREQAAKKIYEGSPEARELIEKHGIDYVVIGPLEKNEIKTMNPAFFDENFPRAGETADTVIYKVGRR